MARGVERTGTGTLAGLRKLAAMAAVCAGAAGCATVEARFERSAYGVEMKRMMAVCLDMRERGELPGIAGGSADRSLSLATEGVDFSARRDIRYPLRLDCIVTQGGRTRSFPFRKETAAGDWVLVR